MTSVLGHTWGAGSSCRPQAWPNPYDNLNDLPVPLRNHFEREAAQWTVEQVEESTAMFTCFMAGKDEIAEEGKKVLESIHYMSQHHLRSKKHCKLLEPRNGQNSKVLEQLCH